MLEKIPNIKNKDSRNFFLIAGPCVVENEAICQEIAETVSSVCNKYSIPYIFKASYRKANRSRQDSFTGLGDELALEIVQKTGKTLSIPTITDIHSAGEASMAAGFVDILQIPALLSRQTDILIAAANTGKFVNIKKGQFMSPSSMKFAVDKILQTGNSKIFLTDRGTMFGYQDLIVDFRSIPEMKELGFPVVMDITHSLQQPNQEKGVSGGNPKMIETIARAAIAVGTDGIFLETHPNPSLAKSDGSNMIALDKLDDLLYKLTELRMTVNKFG